MTAIEMALAGRISPEIALARMVLGGATVAEIETELAACAGEPAAAGMLALVTRYRGSLERLAGVFEGTGLDHAEAGGAELIARVAGAYDVAVARSPEASVAAYSLGDAATLARATAELVGWLEGAGVLPAGADVLDVGCGIGRVAAAMLPRARSVLGLDVSAGMVAEARRRYPDRRLRFEVTHGRDLAGVAAGEFDVVLASDCFPYLVQAGLAGGHVAGAARALRAGGALVVLNLSYRGDAAADLADATRWAREAGMVLERAGETPFALWDASAWVFRRR
ncbi:MAG: class I SAM-dependent methyltransferase [Janthinobacterium lividum]